MCSGATIASTASSKKRITTPISGALYGSTRRSLIAGRTPTRLDDKPRAPPAYAGRADQLRATDEARRTALLQACEFEARVDRDASGEGRFHSGLCGHRILRPACYRYIDLNPVRAGLVRRPAVVSMVKLPSKHHVQRNRLPQSPCRLPCHSRRPAGTRAAGYAALCDTSLLSKLSWRTSARQPAAAIDGSAPSNARTASKRRRRKW